MKVHYLHI